MASPKKIKQNVNVVDYCDFDVNRFADNIDLVIVCKSQQCADDYVFESIYGFLKTQKSVVNFHKLPANLEQTLIDFARDQCVEYVPSDSGFKEDYMVCNDSIDIPVVYVAGMIDDMNQFESIINLNDLFKKNNYRSGFMTFDGYGKMLGGEVLSSGKIDFNNLQQTYEYLNLTISEYVLKNDLDVLFIEIPAAFFSIYNQNGKNFPLLILNAVCNPDYIIMNVFDNFFQHNTIQDFEEFANPFFGKNVDAYYITPIIEDIVTYEICEPPKSFAVNHSAEIDLVESEKTIITAQMKNRYEVLLYDIEKKLSGQY